MHEDSNDKAALVLGASGGIGAAFAAELVAGGRFGIVYGSSTRGDLNLLGVKALRIDLLDEASLARAADQIKAAGHQLDRVIVASGILKTGACGPEKALRAIEPDTMAQVLAVNTIGPALALKAFTPLMPRKGRSVFAALSARVGSISDNRLGGWYSYRASKAALNQVIKTASIELKRMRPDLICVGLHPGTVDTNLSKDFQAGVAQDKLFTPPFSARSLNQVLEGLDPSDSGLCFDFNGKRVPA